MIGRRSELQLGRDTSGRLLPWVIAVVICLGTLALAGAFVLNRTAAAWQRSITGSLTVQVEPDEAAEARAAAAATLLRATPGVASVRVLPRSEVERLVEPWLGRGDALRGLPLPELIDVELAAGASPDLAALAARLTASVPGTSLDDHGRWLAGLLRLIRALQVIAGSIIGLLALATVLLIVFATRAGLAAHRQVIEVLHLIGARDAYIARQFQDHTLRLALFGAVPGMAAAALVLLVLGHVGAAWEAPLLPSLGLAPAEWAMLPGLPAAAALLAMVTARLTVLRTLKRML